MKRHRRTISILVFLAVLAVPGGASATPLLSGYGGPGEGNQALLGAALVHTPKGGGKGSPTGGSGSSASESGSLSAGSDSALSSATSGRFTGRARRGGSAGGPAKGGKSTAGGRSGGGRASAPAARPRALYPAASQEVLTGGSRTVGLSGQDLLYALLAVGVLLLTAALTWRVAREEPGSRHG